MKIFSPLLLALALMAGLPAHAATLASVDLGGGVSYALVDSIGAANVNIDHLAMGTLNASGVPVGPAVMDVSNATIVKGDLAGQYVRPLGVGMNEKYLSVFGSPSDGSATFTVNGFKNALAFSWGSIDSYNTLDIWDGNGVQYSITGDMLAAALSSITLGTTGHYFTFTALSGIDKFVLSSTTNSFEAANFRLSNVPLPAALPLFGAALWGIAGLRLRRKKA